MSRKKPILCLNFQYFYNLRKLKQSVVNMAIKVALIGNPNVGKTVIFNNLTGAKQHVANWPGVTVEKKEGKLIHKGFEMNIIDLPGIYSLSARSIDEQIARDFIIKEKPEVVVDIVDATTLERNLYLTFLLLELNANLVIVLNMWDAVEASGAKIDVKGLSERLGVPIIPTAATLQKGMKELKDAIVKSARKKAISTGKIIKYRPEIEAKISQIGGILKQNKKLIRDYPLRWVSIKVLEKDKVILDHIKEIKLYDKVIEVLR